MVVNEGASLHAIERDLRIHILNEITDAVKANRRVYDTIKSHFESEALPQADAFRKAVADFLREHLNKEENTHLAAEAILLALIDLTLVQLIDTRMWQATSIQAADQAAAVATFKARQEQARDEAAMNAMLKDPTVGGNA